VPLISTSTAAATAVIGFDLIGDSPLRQSLRNRTVSRVGLSGSAAAGDTLCRVMAGSVEIGTIYNNATGAVQADSGLLRVNWAVPSSQNLSVVVVDIPATNPIFLTMELS